MTFEGIHPTPWQFDTWSSNGLWFWRPTMRIRPSAALIQEMADVVSKNGNYLLNVTPDPQGVINPDQIEMLSDIGHWLATNGEAIYGTRPWTTFGEGPTPGLGSSFRADTPKTPYTSQDIRFTTKGDTLYAIVLAWPANGKVTIRSVTEAPKGVKLLGSDRPAPAHLESSGLTVDLTQQTPSPHPFVLKIERR